MGLFDKLKKAKVQPITLHPQCREAHKSVMQAWVNEHTIEAMNPTTGEWVEVEEPIFDPAISYRISSFDVTQDEVVATRPVAETYYNTAPVNRVAPSKLKRGDIYEATDGTRYLVIADKALILSDYKASLDDEGQLIVVRHDAGMKSSFAHRNANGTRNTNPSKNLIRKVGTLAMPTIYMKGTHKVLLERKNDLVTLDITTQKASKLSK